MPKIRVKSLESCLPAGRSRVKGFTLIELLVVISILAVLSVVGMAVFTGVTKGARDARRKEDIDAMAKAYEIQKTAGYIPLLDANFASGSIPEDPSKGDYFNWLDSNGAGFKVCASLDNNPGNACNTPAANCYCKFSTQGSLPANSTYHSSTLPTTITAGIGGSSQSSCDTNGTLASGLVGYWKMDENSGTTTAADSSGTENNGIYTNGATTTTRVPAQTNNTVTGSFDGIDDFVSIPASPTLNITGNNPISISLWVKPATTTYQRILWKEYYNNVSDNGGYFIQINSGNAYFYIRNDGSAAALLPITANEWVHLVGVYDGSSVKLYKNGSTVATTPYTGGIGNKHTPQPLSIGQWPYSNSQIDDVRIYNWALSGGSADSEITALYNGGNGCFTP